MNQRRAIGVLNTDLSPQHRRRDIEVIAAIARDRGYELAQLLTINADTYMPITYIVHEAVISGAVAVVAPGVVHLGEHAEALTHAVTLEIGADTVRRQPEWDGAR
ncbi:hypothetical protein BOX37_23465 [Nocardia mangyaensis]|uniref:Uncharacterized protein n=1 Tax=Nocardia mangyaensis TaxID=2213200 RepID=A0A1J0VWJ1_9NOCA|nr:hypothetical protein [Nocardia mangyaensis]APE36398.1 hypothetical protein BOX37_23465 [Nocardia mangyaensis]